MGIRYSPGISMSAVAREKLLRNRQRSSSRNDLGRRERERERQESIVYIKMPKLSLIENREKLCLIEKRV